MEQPRVGDAPEPLSGVGIVEADRFVGEVAARHHEHLGYGRIGTGHRIEEQMVDRRVRQEHADERVAGRNERRERALVAPTGEHDRPLRAGQERRLALVDARRALGGGEVADHDGERLVGPILAPAQRRQRHRATCASHARW